MKNLRIYTYGEKQPEVEESVWRLVRGYSTGTWELKPSNLKDFCPTERFPDEPPYPEPLIGWFPGGQKPLDSDLWVPGEDL